MFQYVPLYGEGGNSNSLGIVGSVTNYDPNTDKPPVDMDDLTRYKGSITTKPSLGMLHGVECDPAKRSVKRMFIRDSSHRDATFTDLGTFYFASSGVPEPNATLGQLWVTYTCRLSVHKLRDLSVKLNESYLDSLRCYFAAGTEFDTENKLIVDQPNTVIRSPFVESIEPSGTSTGVRNHYIRVNLKNLNVGDKIKVTTVNEFVTATGNTLRGVNLYPIYERQGLTEIFPAKPTGPTATEFEGVVDNAGSASNDACMCGVSYTGFQITSLNVQPYFWIGVRFLSDATPTTMPSAQPVLINLRIEKMEPDSFVAGW
jgi:hypothetical protein